MQDMCVDITEKMELMSMDTIEVHHDHPHHINHHIHLHTHHIAIQEVIM